MYVSVYVYVSENVCLRVFLCVSMLVHGFIDASNIIA